VPADRLHSRMHGGTVVRSVGRPVRRRRRTDEGAYRAGVTQRYSLAEAAGPARHEIAGPELELDGRPWQGAGLLLAPPPTTGSLSVVTPICR